jgi:hypothetical protein
LNVVFDGLSWLKPFALCHLLLDLIFNHLRWRVDFYTHDMTPLLCHHLVFSVKSFKGAREKFTTKDKKKTAIYLILGAGLDKGSYLGWFYDKKTL